MLVIITENDKYLNTTFNLLKSNTVFKVLSELIPVNKDLEQAQRERQRETETEVLSDTIFLEKF